MTTHTLTGFVVSYDTNGDTIGFDTAVFTGVTSDVFTLSYTNPVVYPGDEFPTVDLEPASGTEFLLEVTYGGTVVTVNDPVVDLDALIGYVVINGQTIEVMTLFDPVSNVDMIFQLSGPLISATTLAEWAALEASITAAGPITTGPFASDTEFEFDDFVTHSSTEHDTITGSSGADDINSGAGNDHVSGLDGADILTGGNGNDKLYGNGGSDRLTGGSGNDRLYGGDNGDRLYGGAGDDRVEGGNGRDVAFLGSGNDEYIDNAQTGANGSDEIRAGDGNDIVRGKGGNELVHGDNGHDRLYGGDGDDRLYGDAGSDRLYGNDGSDRLYGGRGQDELAGGGGGDRLYGNDGGDHLVGHNGKDRLYGGNGDDRLEGGLHGDQMSGGAGTDTFVFRTSLGNDTILDFSKGEDILRMDDAIWGGGLTAAQVVSTYASVVGGEVVFDFGSSDTITLEGVSSLAGLDADILIF